MSDLPSNVSSVVDLYARVNNWLETLSRSACALIVYICINRIIFDEQLYQILLILIFSRKRYLTGNCKVYPNQ